MFELVFKINPENIKKIYDVSVMYAGILYDEDGYPADKIMFSKNNNVAIDVFSGKVYSLNRNDDVYVGDVVSLFRPIIDLFGKAEITFVEAVMVYKMFLDKPTFINKNLDYFGLFKVDVGYKGKTEIIEKRAKYSWLGKDEKTIIYYKLMKIIDYESQKRQVKKNGRSKRK